MSPWPLVRKTVTLTVPASKLAFYDKKVHQFVVEPGNYDILIGRASDSGYEYRSIRYDDREFACLLINGRDTCALPR